MAETVGTLKHDHRITLIGPRGCREFGTDCEAVYEVSPNPLLFNAGALLVGTWVLLHKRFSLIIGGSGLASPATSTLQMLFSTPSCVFVHGLDLVVDHSLYQRLVLPMIRRARKVIANSRSTAQIAQDAGIRGERISVLNPGTNLPSSQPKSGFTLRKQENLGPGPLILYVGRIIERKGLLPFLEHSMPQIVLQLPDAQLLVLGDDASDAANKTRPLLGDVRRAVEEQNLAEHVRFMGRADDQLLDRAYTEADVLIFPLVQTKGDVEGFGMVAIEAAAHGTPTVAFDLGGVADAVADGTSGILVEPADYRKFTTATLDLIRMSSEYDAGCRAHAGQFSWSNYGQKLSAILEEID